MLVVRQSSNIKADIKRNSSNYMNTAMNAASKSEYVKIVANKLFCSVETIQRDYKIVRLSAGCYCLQHHEWLSSMAVAQGENLQDWNTCKLINREEFDAMNDTQKTELAEACSWSSQVQFEDGNEFVSFDASQAELIFSVNNLHVFDVPNKYTAIETAPTFDFLNAF